MRTLQWNRILRIAFITACSAWLLVILLHKYAPLGIHNLVCQEGDGTCAMTVSLLYAFVAHLAYILDLITLPPILTVLLIREKRLVHAFLSVVVAALFFLLGSLLLAVASTL
jgi:hypothetical protein